MEDAMTKILLKMVRLVVGRAILPRGDPSQGRLPHEAAQGFILRLRRRPTSSRRAILREISMKRTPALLLGALVGSLAVAASNPNIIYAGSGEGLQRPDLSTGDGVYKSTDAGKTWTHLGLRDGQQI